MDPAAVEQWFIREGTPTLIRGYSFRRHVLPRALSFMVAFGLVVLVVALSVSAFNGFVVLLLVVLAAVAWFGLRRARRSQRPLVARAASALMLVAWFAWPVVVPVLIVATQQPEDLIVVLPSQEAEAWYDWVTTSPSPELNPVTSGDVVDETGLAVLYLAGIWLVVSAAALTATWFGVVPLAKRTLEDAIRHLFDVLYIQSRALPAMVFLTLFLFINADMWQASEFLTPVRLAVALSIFASVAVLAAVAKLREERDNLIRQSNQLAHEPGDRMGNVGAVAQVPELPPLTRTQRFNVVLAFSTRQIAQSVWVGLGVFVFLFALGVTVVPAKTAARWVGDDYQKLSLMSIPVALLYAALLLAGFAAMYFAVTSMTDPALRERFFAPTARGLQEVLRTHATYSAIVGAPDVGPDARTVAHRVAEHLGWTLREILESYRQFPGDLRRTVRRRGRARGGDPPAGSAEDGESGGDDPRGVR